MKLWQFLKQQYAFVIRTAATPLAHRLMLLYAALESIILPIPVDPLLAAVVLGRHLPGPLFKQLQAQDGRQLVKVAPVVAARARKASNSSNLT